MQEDVENKSVSLSIKTVKLTANVLKKAILKFLAVQQGGKSAKSQVIPHGKQTVKQLVGQNQGVANIEVTDKNIKAFERVARKYGVDFAIKKDRSDAIPKYLVFFKARDADALTAAFTEFTGKKVKKAQRPSVLAQLRKLVALGKDKPMDRSKSKHKEQTL